LRILDSRPDLRGEDSVLSLTDYILSAFINHLVVRSDVLAIVDADHVGSRPQQFEAGTTSASCRARNFQGYRSSGKTMAIR
jgi:hypothetical protein